MTTNSTITPELLDQLLANYEKPEDLTGDDGLFKQLKKALIERALGAELTDHLGYEKGDPTGRRRGNSRNGSSSKTLLTEDGKVDIAVPRDRAGSFEPQLIAKGQTHFDGFDDKVLSLYARGMTVREIQGHLAELYGTEVSPDLISRVTDAVLDEVREWQNRPLDPVYPVVFFDALRVKIRDEGLVKNKAVYVALALNPDGEKDVLGLWIEQTEGAKFWLKVVNDIKARGVNDILIAVVDGLKGFPEAITSVFPQTTVQTCIVHLIRNSLAFVSWRTARRSCPRSRRSTAPRPPTWRSCGSRNSKPNGANALAPHHDARIHRSVLVCLIGGDSGRFRARSRRGVQRLRRRLPADLFDDIDCHRSRFPDRDRHCIRLHAGTERIAARSGDGAVTGVDGMTRGADRPQGLRH